MRTTIAILAVLLAATSGLFLVEGDEPEKKEAPPAAQETKPAELNAPSELNALEKRFVESLTGAVLAGRWRLVKDGVLGEEKEERYTIHSAAKVGGDFWVINARIQYGGKDVTVPCPVKVLWAGDTPVISITNVGIPGMGTYTARVVIHEGLYTGTWFGPNVGGFLSGTIQKSSEGKKGA